MLVQYVMCIRFWNLRYQGMNYTYMKEDILYMDLLDIWVDKPSPVADI